MSLLRCRVARLSLPSSSLRARWVSTEPAQYKRPLAEGVLPAYDEALKIIEEDSRRKREDIARIRSKGQLSSEEEARLNTLEAQSEINLPEVRWKFANGQADMSRPVHRHLAEKKWREEGRLDLLMQRVHTMNVIPDLVPDFHPSLDLHVTFPTPPTREKSTLEEVEPGVFLLPEQTLRPPKLNVTAFHPEKKLYTLLMVDPDVPDVANRTYQTYLHWLEPNISLSATTTTQLHLPLPARAHTRYIPPHPQNGTSPHRYVIFLFPNPDPSTPLSIPTVSDEQRRGFNLRAFLEQHGINPKLGGGVHLWRSKWSPGVSKIYETVLQAPEPRYGVPPRPDRYAELRSEAKYV